MLVALTPPLSTSPVRRAIGGATRRPEPELLPGLPEQARSTAVQAEAAQALALRIAAGVRERARAGGRAGLVQGLLQEFALSSQQGVAPMWLAATRCASPDAATRDALIRDKTGSSNWPPHVGQSPLPFVVAASWGPLSHRQAAGHARRIGSVSRAAQGGGARR